MAYIKGDTEEEQKHFDFLEDLRQSGDTNMLVAWAELALEFGLDAEISSTILSKWMKAHGGKSHKVGQ